MTTNITKAQQILEDAKKEIYKLKTNLEMLNSGFPMQDNKEQDNIPEQYVYILDRIFELEEQVMDVQDCFIQAVDTMDHLRMSKKEMKMHKERIKNMKKLIKKQVELNDSTPNTENSAESSEEGIEIPQPKPVKKKSFLFKK